MKKISYDLKIGDTLKMKWCGDKTIKNLKKKLVEKGFIAVVEQGYKMCLKYVVFS